MLKGLGGKNGTPMLKSSPSFSCKYVLINNTGVFSGDIDPVI
jgi:hypothetical protein